MSVPILKMRIIIILSVVLSLIGVLINLIYIMFFYSKYGYDSIMPNIILMLSEFTLKDYVFLVLGDFLLICGFILLFYCKEKIYVCASLKRNDNIKPFEILNRIKPSFSFLLDDYKFSLVDYKESASFGDFYIILKSDDFILRFISDRGQPVIEISPPTDKTEWFDLCRIAFLLLGGECDKYYDFEKMGNFIRDNYSYIKNLFCADEVTEIRKKLWELEQMRLREKYPAIAAFINKNKSNK